jgi:hypothetical protein
MKSSPVERKANHENNHQRAGSESVIGGTEMNAEQRQRASQLVRSQTEEEAIGEAFALLQELIDAPEPKPVGEVVDFNGWRIVRWKGDESDFQVGTKFYTSPPAPSVPEPAAKVLHVDGLLSNNLIDCDLPVGTLLYTAPAAPVPARLVWDAERHQWLRTYNTAKHPAVAEEKKP